jgi:hypothetical protein
VGIAAVMVTAGIFILMAGIRNESVPSILASVIKGDPLAPAATVADDTPGGGDWQGTAPAPLSPAAYQLAPGQAGPVLPRP